MEGMFFIAVVCRARGLGLAVLSDQKIIEIKRQRVLPNESLRSAIRRMVDRTAEEYGVRQIIIEADNPKMKFLRSRDRYTVREITVVEAKNVLLPDETAPTLHGLYSFLLGHFDQMKRFVTMTQRNSELSTMNDRRRLTPLLALGLGLADRYRSLSENLGTKHLV
jgi:hypothetical protein